MLKILTYFCILSITIQTAICFNKKIKSACWNSLEDASVTVKGHIVTFGSNFKVTEAG